MYESVKKEISDAVDRKVSELGLEIKSILTHHVGTLMQEIMTSGLEGNPDTAAPTSNVAQSLPDKETPNPKKFKTNGTYKSGTGPDIFSTKGSRLPPTGTLTRKIYDNFVKLGEAHPKDVVHALKDEAASATVFSLIRQLRKRGWLNRSKSGKFSAAAPAPAKSTSHNNQ